MKTDFEVLHQMMKENKSIKVTTELTEIKMVKKGGKMTFGIDAETYHDISKSYALGKGTHYVVAYIIDKKEFDKIKDQN